jgi:hypothetical protein
MRIALMIVAPRIEPADFPHGTLLAHYRVPGRTIVMRGCHRTIGVLLCLSLVIGIRTGRAHETSLQRFLRQRAIALALAQQVAERAPRADAGEQPCRLTIELMLDRAPQPVAGLIRVTNLASGKVVSFSEEIHRDKNWFALAPKALLNVPRTKLRVEAFHGLETSLATREVDLTGKETGALAIPLTHFYDAAARGLKSGNTHLHLMKLTHQEMDRYLRTVPQADGLDLVFISLLRRIPDERDYITNTLTEGDLGRLSQAGVLFGNGEEHRHNFGTGGEGFGHVMLLNILKLIQPVSVGSGIMKEGTDGIPLQRGIRTALEDGATVIWCHNTFGHEDIPNWVTGLVHAQNIFDGGEHGTYEDTFYRYLNAGLRVPFSTGTDWFIYDFSRVYVPYSGTLTSKQWLAELAAGKSYITNGVFLEFTADGKRIGDTIAAVAGQEVRIVGKAIGRNDFGKAELIHSGRVVHSVDSNAADGHFAASIDFKLKVTEPGWVALRIPRGGGQNEFGKELFAHTSPIYITVNGRQIFRPDVARGLLSEMAASQEFIKSKAEFANDGEREAVLRVYRDAIAGFQKKVEEHKP